MNRDIRTIQRQLEMLSEHFDIERDERNKPYGYKNGRTGRGVSFSPMLSEQESLLLTLAEQHLRNLLPASLMKSMEGFVQARTNLGPHANSKRETRMAFKVRVVSTTQPLLHKDR